MSLAPWSGWPRRAIGVSVTRRPGHKRRRRAPNRRRRPHGRHLSPVSWSPRHRGGPSASPDARPVGRPGSASDRRCACLPRLLRAATTPFVAFSRCVPAERSSCCRSATAPRGRPASDPLGSHLIPHPGPRVRRIDRLTDAGHEAASQVKVVIVVGPVEGSTAKYIDHARGYAAHARAYGAAVTEVYSPRATWTAVKAAAVGANIFIYLGHGNGYPSPYGAFSSLRKNGLGLNASYNPGNSNVKYWGQYYMRTGSIWPATRWSCSTTCATRQATPSPAGRYRPSRSRCSEPTATARASCGPVRRRCSRPATAACRRSSPTCSQQQDRRADLPGRLGVHRCA